MRQPSAFQRNPRRAQLVLDVVAVSNTHLTAKKLVNGQDTLCSSGRELSGSCTW